MEDPAEMLEVRESSVLLGLGNVFSQVQAFQAGGGGGGGG